MKVATMEGKSGIWGDGPLHPLGLFAEAVAMTRQEETGVSIQDVARCFKHQFDEAELESLIKELRKPLHGPESSCPIDECPHCYSEGIKDN